MTSVSEIVTQGESVATTMSIVRIADAPSLAAVVAEVKLTEGDFDTIRGPLRSPDVEGEWRIGRYFYQPLDPLNKAVKKDRRPLVLHGPKVLEAGMRLTDGEV